MAEDSILPDEFRMDLEYLKSIGRERLISLQHEAARRLENQARIYGTSGYRPGRQALLELWWRVELKQLGQALTLLDEEGGVVYRPRFLPDSRESISEHLCVAEQDAREYVFDEGVDDGMAISAQEDLRSAKKEAHDLDALGYPLTPEEMSNAAKRLADRRFRMRNGYIRRMDPISLCPACRATVYADSTYCPYCGTLVGVKPGALVFICHGSENKDWCLKLAHQLKLKNVRAWIDVKELVPGDSLQEGINAAIESCDVFLLIASRDSLSRAWPMEELKAAVNLRLSAPKRVSLIPILVENCVDLLPPLLKDTIYQSFFNESGPLDLETKEGAEAIDILVAAIMKHVGKAKA